MTSTVQDLEKQIREANMYYRKGEAIMSDPQYDTLLEELEMLDPNNELLTDVGIDVTDSDRKEKLPIHMASMNKVKTVEEISKWARLKGLSEDTELVASPKYDGASLSVEEIAEQGWTRGNGIVGQRSDEHLKLINRQKISNLNKLYTFGELIMPRQVFLDKYSEEFSNPRNLVAGQLNHKTPNEILRDCNYIAYGLESDELSFSTKSEQFNYLNSLQKHIVPYELVKVKDLTVDMLNNMFEDWSREYEIDGIILEVNSMEIRNRLGRETSSNNPCYARAFKGSFEEVKETVVRDITWQISKKGLLKPVIQVETIELDGVNVSNVTGNNAKFMKDMGIGIGSRLKVKRSGMVIPLIVSVEHSTGFELPTIEGVEIDWNENGVELVTQSVTDDQRLRQLIAFFEILEVENLGEGILKEFFDAGYDTPKKVLSMSVDDMLQIDRFAEKKANNVKKAIDDKRKVTLSKLQHASGFFNNLGSKKLLLLEDLNDADLLNRDILKNDIMNREGFSEISADNYLDGIHEYKLFEQSLHGLISVCNTEFKTAESNDLEGMVFVFTGVRDKEANATIESRGGKIASGVSKNSTHLIMKEKGSGSSKEKKALELGQTIWNLEELNDFL